MKKILFSLALMLLGTVLFTSNTFAAEDKNVDFTNEQEILIQKAHEEMLSSLKNGATDQELKEGRYYKEVEALFKSKPELKDVYIKNLDVYNNAKVEKKLKQSGINIGVSDISKTYTTEEFIVFDDGSFIKSTLIDSPDYSQITPFVTNSFGNRTTTNKNNIYHLAWFDGIIQLNTKYRLSKSGIEITGTDHSGTYAIFPSSVVGKTKIEIKKATKKGSIARSLGEYSYTIGGYKGIGLISINPSARTSYTLNKINASSVNYTISNTFNKY